MSRYDIPSAPINNIAEVFDDEQVKASGIVKKVQHPGIGELKVSEEKNVRLALLRLASLSSIHLC